MNCAELSKPLYHGSDKTVCEIDLSMSVPKKDFGRGFYTTNDRIQAGKALDDVAKLFFSSELYASLCDRNTGYYWDSIPDMIERFYAETPSLAETRWMSKL